MPTTTCRVIVTEGIHCAGCVARLERTLGAAVGVASVRASLVSREAAFAYDPAITSPAALIAALAKAGYAAVPVADAVVDDGSARLRRARTDALAAAVLALPLVVVGMGPAMHDTAWHYPAALLALMIVIGPGRRLVLGGLADAVRARWSMDALVGLSCATALLVSLVLTWRGAHQVWYEAAGMTVAFVLLGRWLEERARHATGAAVRLLLARAPATAIVMEPDGEREVPAALVLVGQRVRLRAGMAAPCDAVVHVGEAEMDESAFTGEPLPVLRRAGDRIAAGSMTVAGGLVAEATAVGAATVLARTAAAVRAAQEAKPPLARLADRIAGIFVPAVLALAGLVAVLWWVLAGDPAAAAIAAASVLAAACPCALGLATPTAIAVAAGRAAGTGILLRDPDALEHAADLDTVVLDKTGTLTTGHPRLVEVLPAPGVARERLLAVAAAVERGSPHPIARALAAADPAAPAAEGFAHHPGAGVSACVDGAPALVGTGAFLLAHGVPVPGVLPALPAGASEVQVACAGCWLGRLALVDALRPGAAAAVGRLAALGCRVVLASGDRGEAVAAAADAAGIGAYHAACTPEGKRVLVETLRGEGRRVAMVGDGVNDAPALAAARVGIALGTGTDVAAAAGSVLLPGDDLAAVGDLIVLARRTRTAIRRNLVFAAVYNLVTLPLAAGVLAPGFGLAPSPAWAAAAMAASSLAVVGSSLLLRGGALR